MITQTGEGERRWVETDDGVRLSVREWGPADGKELLFIHGQAQCHLCFQPQIESLADRFRIVAFDMRGHGESSKPDGVGFYANPARWGEDIATVLRATALRRPVAVGWSMGGRSLREYLDLYGDQDLAGINLVGSRLIERPEFMANVLSFWQLGEAAPVAEQIAASEKFLRACYYRQPPAEEFTRVMAYNMLLPFEAHAAITAWQLDPEATLAKLRQISVPTLISHGLQDAVVPLASSELVAATIPGGRLSIYEDSSHSPFYEQPTRFSKELAEFVEECAKVDGR